ncbi:MAG: fumarylacetoacetate hydrolase family protein [Burkholderiaceae bacterium]
MRIVAYMDGAVPAWGWLRDDNILPLQVNFDGSSLDLLALFAQARAHAANASTTQRGRALADTILLAPIAPGATVYCVGINYKAHAGEAGRELPSNPSLFLRRPSSLVGAGQPLRRPIDSVQLDFEGELALVIGRAGRHIATADAMQHVAAYTCFNDGSVRDFQRHSVTAGKNFEASGACGPWLTSADEVTDPGDLRLRTRVNGVEMQLANTSQLIYPVATLISYVSCFAQLRPGDVIATGTPEGVGAARNPPQWLAPGDQVSIEISGVGRLDNPVAEEAS